MPHSSLPTSPRSGHAAYHYPLIHSSQQESVPDIRRRSASAGGNFSLTLSPTPVPPSLLRRITPDAGMLHMPQGHSLNALSCALRAPSLSPNSSPRSQMYAVSRTPSPLPPSSSPLPLMSDCPLPSEVEQISQRLSRLVRQSNAYVASLTRRMDAITQERAAWGEEATLEQISLFLLANPEFAPNDLQRMYNFRLPLTVWQRIAIQVKPEHSGTPGGLAAALYWRARAESEALGFLCSDHMTASSSEESVCPQSVGDVIESRRNSVISTVTSVGLEDSPPGRGPSPKTHSGYFNSNTPIIAEEA